MIRASKICREYNISLERLIKLSKPFYQIESNPNAKIPSDLIEKLFSKIPKPENQLQSVHNVLSKENFESFDIYIQKDNLTFRTPKEIKNQSYAIDSIFTDQEAFSICFGLKNEIANRIARKFLKNSFDSQNAFDMHQIAMKAKDKGGNKLLSLIMELTPVPAELNMKNVFKVLDKQMDKNSNPAVRILFENKNEENEKLQVCFYSETIENKVNVDSDIIVIKNIKTKKTIMSISRSGNIVREKDLKNFVPIFRFFISFSHSPKDVMLNYGLDTRECSVCFRELTTARSIEIGMGPVCYSKT